MNIVTMTNEELLNEIEVCAREQHTFEGLTELVKRVFKGSITNDQIKEAQRKGYSDIWEKMLEAYKAEKYFGQQGLDYLSHLFCTELEIELDQWRWKELQGAAQALDMMENKIFLEIKIFAENRIEPSYKDRRQFIFKNSLREMDTRQQRAFIKNRKDYNNIKESPNE